MRQHVAHVNDRCGLRGSAVLCWTILKALKSGRALDRVDLCKCGEKDIIRMTMGEIMIDH